MPEATERETPGGESVTHRTLSGLFWMVSGGGLQAVLRVLVLVVLARLLSPEDFGVVAAALIIVDFMEIFSDFGMGPAIVQAPRLEERHVRTAFTISVLLGCVFAALIWLAAPLVAGFFRAEGVTPVLRAMSLVFPLDSLSLVASSLLRRELEFRKITKITVASYALGYGAVGITLAALGFGVWALVAANLSQTVMMSAAFLVAQPHPKRPLLDRRAARELTFMGGGYSAAHVLNYVALKGDNAVVGRWLGASALGLYTRAYGLMTIPLSVFGTPLDKVLFSAMSKVRHERERLATAYRRGVALVTLVVLPVSVVMYLLAPELIYVLLGPQWEGVVAPFQVLAIGTLFRLSYKLSASVAKAAGAVYRNAWRQGVYALLVVAGSWAGHFWGLWGVAVGVLFALFVNYVLTAQLGLRLTSMTWRQFLAAHLPGAWLAVVIYAEVWATSAGLAALNAPVGVVLAGSLAVVGLTLAALLWFQPALALGKDGMWMLRTLAEFGGRRFGFLRRLKKGLDAAPSSA